MSIRMATENDIAQILEIYAPYILSSAATFEYSVPTLEAFTRRFRDITVRFPWLVWEENGKVLGYAYGSAPFERAAFQWCAECSVYILPDCHGKGIGKALYQQLEKLLTLQGFRKVYAIITTENENSVAFHRAAGFTETARLPGCGFKFGRWYGVTWMEKPLNSVELPSCEPFPIAAIVNNDRFFQ